MNIQDAIDVIESVAGFTDESTPVGEAWLEVLSFIHRPALTQPEPEGPTDEEWEALKERAWDRYRTVGYQGELFIYDRDFDTALDDVRRKLAHYAHPAIKPGPEGVTS